MRTDDEGQPLTHRIEHEPDPQSQLSLDVAQLIQKGQALLDRDRREAASRALADQRVEASAAAMRRANAAAERFEWRPIASVALFEVQVCRHCSRESQAFRGFQTLYRQKASTVEMMKEAPCIDAGLPFEKRTLISNPPVCSHCLSEFVAKPSGRVYEFVAGKRSAE